MSGGALSLPPEIQIVLKRKSSRDPASRFSNKLLSLLNYAGSNLNLQEYIGVGWLNECRFRINKKRLIAIMDIKLNTLNVNLKDLRFRQLQGDQNGWTIWERPGFRFDSTVDDLAKVERSTDAAQQWHAFEEAAGTKLSKLKDINIGMADAETVHSFKRIAASMWDEFLAMHPQSKSKIDKAEFLDAAAKRFRASHQKLSNSKLVLETIFMCFSSESLGVVDFAKLLALFGPEATLMEKIASILKSSNEYHDWLKIVHDPSELVNFRDPEIYGFFDVNEHNCFTLKRANKPDLKIYNIVDQPATGEYLIDSNGVKYGSWQDYFGRNSIC